MPQQQIIDRIHNNKREKVPLRKKWDIPKDVLDLVINGNKIRIYKPEELLSKSQFYLVGSLFGMGGITFHRKAIMIHKSTQDLKAYRQAARIYHELVHVAQQLDMGWVGFMAEYSKQWISSGCSYDNMCKIGLEKEAYTAEGTFIHLCQMRTLT